MPWLLARHSTTPIREYYAVIQCAQCWWAMTCGCRDEDSNPGPPGSEKSALPLGHCPCMNITKFMVCIFLTMTRHCWTSAKPGWWLCCLCRYIPCPCKWGSPYFRSFYRNLFAHISVSIPWINARACRLRPFMKWWMYDSRIPCVNGRRNNWNENNELK